jgi:hypothetical protein
MMANQSQVSLRADKSMINCKTHARNKEGLILIYVCPYFPSIPLREEFPAILSGITVQMHHS